MNDILDRVQTWLLDIMSVGFDTVVIALTFLLVGMALTIALVLMPVGALVDWLARPSGERTERSHGG